MSGTRNTSRTFAALAKAKELLEGAPFTARENTGLVPAVDYSSDSQLQMNAELVELLVDIEASSIVWRASPAEREERFVLVIVIRTGSWETTDAAAERVESLADCVQRAFYSDNDSTGIPLPDKLALGVNGVDLGGFASCIPNFYRDGNGVVGEAELRYQVVAHI